MTNGSPQQRYSFFAESFAAFAVVYVASVALYADRLDDGSLGLIGRSLAAGAVTASVVTATARRAPGLGNPAVLCALGSIGRLSIRSLARLFTAELTGAVLGAAFARGLFPAEILFECRGGTPIWSDALSVWQATFAEATFGFVLVAVLMRTTRLPLRLDSAEPVLWTRPALTGLVAGLMVTALGLSAGPVTGGVANPIRALGPALTSGFFDAQLAYWVGPLAGAVLAAVTINVCDRPR